MPEAGLTGAKGMPVMGKMKNKMEAILESTITCPSCGHKKEEIMPRDACQSKNSGFTTSRLPL